MSWHENIKIGDILTVDQKWNQTCSKNRHLPERVKVLDIKSGEICESGIMLKVNYKSAGTVWLSAAWFLKPEKE